MNEDIRNILEEIGTTVADMIGSGPLNLAGVGNPHKYDKQGKGKQKKAELRYKYVKSRGSNAIVEAGGHIVKDPSGKHYTQFSLTGIPDAYEQKGEIEDLSKKKKVTKPVTPRKKKVKDVVSPGQVSMFDALRSLDESAVSDQCYEDVCSRIEDKLNES